MTSNHKQKDIKRFEKLYLKGLNVQELANEFNITLGAVYKRIRKINDDRTK